MDNTTLVLVHGFWSSTATWHKLARRLGDDPRLAGLRLHSFGYESPRLRLPLSWTRIPDYHDIAQSLSAELTFRVPHGDLVLATHSQGGLIVQRFLAWMANEGRARELARIRLIIMLACPNQGSDYGRSIRRMTGFGRHAQARDLQTLSADVAAAQRTVQRQIVAAIRLSDRECPIPIHAYAGRSDNIVRRPSAQGGFTHVSTIPGNHFSILDPEAKGNITAAVISGLIRQTAGAAPSQLEPPPANYPLSAAPAPGTKFAVSIGEARAVMIGDGNTQINDGSRRSADMDPVDGLPPED
ncbi:alpha/beta fold hydrolase [Micromonospora profundi]|uniref:Alpha/beta fold hydrolase n=1 Tax=Micromonospora profundi TaxID=1420889 RepID=A0AAJ6HQQ3_9ACTN|nr:alpha/beta fold hydrolase [Micromonospora profundi]WLS43263.1 alpha/beta fold hydrolase [Micromonospora profundi]